MKKRLLFWGVKIATVILFLAVCTVAILLAYGYKFNGKLFGFQKTSIIDLFTETQEDAEIYLNDKLLANRLPAQLKGINLGLVNLSIRKPGFWSYEDILSVREDIVTRLTDVVLVPMNLNDFAQVVKVFDRGFVFLGFGDNSEFVAYNKEQKLIEIYNLNASQVQKIASIKADDLKDEINSIELINHTLLLNMSDGKRFVTQDWDSKFEEIILPTSFAWAGDGYFYGKQNLLFRTDLKGNVAKIYNANLEDISGVKYVIKAGVKFLIVSKSNNGKQSLYLLINDDLKLINEDYAGDLLVNSEDNYFVYKTADNELFFYDYLDRDDQSELLARWLDPVRFLAFFPDRNHLLYQKGDQLWVSDLYMQKSFQLLDAKPEQSFFTLSGQSEALWQFDQNILKLVTLR